MTHSLTDFNPMGLKNIGQRRVNPSYSASEEQHLVRRQIEFVQRLLEYIHYRYQLIQTVNSEEQLNIYM